MRKSVAAMFIVVVTSVGVLSTATAAEARDSGWGCGGACRVFGK